MGKLLNEQVRKKVLAKITPAQNEIHAQQEMITKLKNQLEDYGSRLQVKYESIEAHGSTGKKQTQLKGFSDIDLFVALNPTDYDKILSLPEGKRDRKLTDLLDGFVEEWFVPAFKELNPSKMQKSYSEHPYLSLWLENQEIDVVCCFDLSREDISSKGTITAVDRTLHHTDYVLKNMKKSMRSDIRLLKSFVRAAHVYGDKCAVGRMGFTGYALELLVIEFGDFEEAVKRIRTLEQNPVDPLSRSIHELQNQQQFRDDKIFIIDPTDHNRNVAASFDPRGYKWLRLRCEELVKKAKAGNEKETMKLLIEDEISTKQLPSWLKPHTLSVEFESDQTIHYTILRDKLYKQASKITSRMETERTGEKKFGKTLAEIYFEGDRYAMGFLVERGNIMPEYERKGPPVSMEEACMKFREANTEVFKRDGYLWSKERREFTSAYAFLHHLVNEEKIKGLKETNESNVSDRVLNTLYRYVMKVEDFPLKKR